MDGTKYRYLSARDYHLYMSDKERHEKGYYFDDSSDRYLVKTVDGSDAYITAVTGWVPGSIPSDGAQIHNDLVGVWHSHTLLGTIAPHAFDGCAELKSLYFKDTDANNYNELEPMKFSIGSYAFANCPNLKEVKLMQYTTKGDNHWEIIRVPQITSVGDSLFAGSPKAKVSCHAQVYQDYLSSKIWKDYWHRFVVYDATTADITLDGVKYHIYRDITETEQLTNKNKKEMVDQQIGWWNTEYKNFNAAELLDATDESQNIYYTSVVGVEDSYLSGHDGKMIIYNDVGEYYNYKNICLTRDAIAGNPNVTSIEFKQTFSPDQTSRSDLKMVIQNGAFEGCTNLKELRMFYRVYIDGMNYLTLGPEDVIPGDNIFGGPVFDEENGLGNEETVESLINSVPKDFKILVASDRYNEFLNDPNWARYSCFIEPVELEVASKRDFDIDGLSYGYIRSLSGIAQTSQTVSQDISWWTVPRIAIEVIQTALTIKSLVTSIKLAKEASKNLLE